MKSQETGELSDENITPKQIRKDVQPEKNVSEFFPVVSEKDNINDQAQKDKS